jgi:hypothetical protein
MKVICLNADLGSWRKGRGRDTIGWARAANAYPPQLNRFVRYGHQIDEVSFHFAFQDGSTRGLHPGLMFLNCQADRYDPFYALVAKKTDLRLVWQ